MHVVKYDILWAFFYVSFSLLFFFSSKSCTLFNTIDIAHVFKQIKNAQTNESTIKEQTRQNEPKKRDIDRKNTEETERNTAYTYVIWGQNRTANILSSYLQCERTIYMHI